MVCWFRSNMNIYKWTYKIHNLWRNCQFEWGRTSSYLDKSHECTHPSEKVSHRLDWLASTMSSKKIRRNTKPIWHLRKKPVSIRINVTILFIQIIKCSCKPKIEIFIYLAWMLDHYISRESWRIDDKLFQKCSFFNRIYARKRIMRPLSIEERKRNEKRVWKYENIKRIPFTEMVKKVLRWNQIDNLFWIAHFNLVNHQHYKILLVALKIRFKTRLIDCKTSLQSLSYSATPHLNSNKCCVYCVAQLHTEIW